MPGHIPKRKLLVISDTAVYKEGGRYLAFEPVVRELNAIAPLFDEIVWLGCKVDKKDKPLAAPGNNIRIVGMPSITRSSFINKLALIYSYPVFLVTILRYFFITTDMHTRAPSHPALIGILLSRFTKKKVWHKYAGNWIEPHPPYMYKLQRSLLKKLTLKNIYITVNGNWVEGNKQIKAFENPCIYESERVESLSFAYKRQFGNTLSLLYVGNLNKAKGILELIAAAPDLPQQFSTLYIIGAGPLYEEVKRKAVAVKNIDIQVLGHKKRAEINEYYKSCDCFILPSYSEGFPKVIAEAASFGCIPFTTNISALSQYIIEGKNGYLINGNTPQAIIDALQLFIDNGKYSELSRNAASMTGKFTYEYFKHRMETEIFN